MSDLLKLDRMGSTPWGTFGTLRLPDGTAFPTLERQWEYNARGKSCIPAGEYLMALRASPMVMRTSGGEFRNGWEVTGVPERDLIMFHPGNWQDDSNGCVLIGRAHVVINGKPGISASRAAFKDFMHRLTKRESWRLAVRWALPE